MTRDKYVKMDYVYGSRIRVIKIGLFTTPNSDVKICNGIFTYQPDFIYTVDDSKISTAG